MKTSFKSYLLFILIILNFCCKKTKVNEDKQYSISKAMDYVFEKNINETIEFYYELKKDSSDYYNFNDENELNSFGYQLLNEGKTEEAIKIFELLVSEFPNLANPYDSLGEAYYSNGNLQESLVNYQKALLLDSENSNAAEWVDRIKYPSIDSTKFYKIYSKKEYIEDIDELAKTITTRNPHPFKFIEEEEFWSALESKKEKITNQTTFSEFIWHCSEIIANINCGHSGFGYFNQENAILPITLRFPLETKLIGGKLYVYDPLTNKGKISAGDEIIEINGNKISKIKDDIFKHIKSQGKIESSKRHVFNAYSSAYIPYSLNFPSSYNITLKKTNERIELLKLTNYKPKPRINSSNVCQKNLCLQINNEKDLAIITIRSFAYYGGKFSEYKEFIDKSFKEISEKKVSNLILDVRMNGGGPSDAGIYLLRYLANEPFVYFSSSAFNEKKEPITPFLSRFNGEVKFLIDGNGGSTTGHVMSIVKHLGLGEIIGEELGSNQFCTGGQISHRMRNTEIFYAVGRYTYITSANSFSDERGVMPDFFVSKNIDDYLNNQDAVLKFALDYIGNK